MTTAPNSDSDADLPRRKGARTMAAIPADMLRSLNRGEIETRTLVEWYAVDQHVLLEHAIPTFGFDFAASSLLQVAEGLAVAKVTDRFNGIAAAIGTSIRGNDDAERIFRAMATHRSDIMRIWA